MKTIPSVVYILTLLVISLSMTASRPFCEEGVHSDVSEASPGTSVGGIQPKEPDGCSPVIEEGTISLSLEQALACVLSRNLDLEIQRFFPLLAEAGVELEHAPFDPVLTALLSNSDVRSQAGLMERITLGINSVDTKSLSASGSLSKKFTTGTEVSVGTELSGQKLSSPLFNTEEYSARNYLTVTQPLLKGFGRPYNTAQIRIAEKKLEVEEILLADRVEEILAAVENSYWELVYAIRSVEIAKESLELARSFLRIAESRLRAGAGIRVDVLEAQAALANREADLYSAENAVKDGEDLLRTLLRLTETPEMWAASIEPGGVPEVLPETPQLDSCLELAVEKRRDHRVLKLQIEEGDLSIQAAKRDRLPSFDLFATYARNGLATEPGPAYKITWNEDFREYTYGFQFSYPFGNHGARAGYDRAVLTRDQARVSLRRLEDQIVQEVRTAWRGMSTELRRVQATMEAERLAEQKLADMQSRYEAGRATSTDVFDFQEDLTRARVEVARAKINALEAATALLRGMGVLADTRGVIVE